MSNPKKPLTATVFGAGVAGLTAAHELVERGFTVTIIDPDIREEVSLMTLDRGIGGMARSQWGAWLQTTPLSPRDENDPIVNIPRLEDANNLLVDDAIVFKGTKAAPTPENPDRAAKIIERVAALLTRFCKVDPETAASRLTLMVGQPAVENGDDPRVTWVKTALRDKGLPAEVVDNLDVGDFFVEDAQITGLPEPRVLGKWLSFQVDDKLLPAEHGFRFFPSFYRHLFDTMGRIPILVPKEHERTHRTVLDNLIPTEGLGFARDKKKISFMIPRTQINSMKVMRECLKNVLSQLEYTLSDINRFSTRLLKYMTSSSERRAGEYESMSWGDFVEETKYSKVSRKHIEFGPQMSAALRGSLSDARTQGNITIQLLMNQLRTETRTDCTLNAPTSTAWLAHWHDYLVSQGVTFLRGRLVDFTEIPGKDGREGKVGPKVVISEPGQDDVYLDPPAESDCYVLALSLQGMVPLVKPFLIAAEKAGRTLAPGNDFERILQFARADTRAALEADLRAPIPKSPLQHLSGIQFYFDVEVQFWRGHTQYLDSAWGLTSIAQPQFWGRMRNSRDAYRSVLSVDIGIWDRLDKDGKCAWDCTPDEIALSAWSQIRDHHDDALRERYGANARLPVPIAYALDANITFGRSDESKPLAPNGDKTPFLVNRVSEFPNRPGRLADMSKAGDVSPEDWKQRSWYDIHVSQYVLAGTYLKTYTRLTSMEGANESARHAVNALLTFLQVRGDRCTIWDPEDNEVDNLEWFRDLDRKRYADGKPHLVDTLSMDDQVGTLSLPGWGI